MLPKFTIYQTSTAAGFQDVLWSGDTTSQSVTVKSLPVVWEAKMHCMKFWMKIPTSEVYEGRLLRKMAREAVKCDKGVWMKNIL